MGERTQKMRNGEMTAADWNAMYPVGTAVRYWPVRGLDDHRDTKTRSEAWALGHGSAVVKIDGQAGGVSVDHLRVLLSREAKGGRRHG